MRVEPAIAAAGPIDFIEQGSSAVDRVDIVKQQPIKEVHMATSQKRSQTKRAQTKRQTRKRTAAAKKATKSAEFVCPECGRTFTRAAALGAHRSRAHGVAGQSKRRSNSKSSTTRRAAQTTATRSDRAGASPSRDGIDRNALLRTLFPNGVPAREEVLRAATGWLDDAERLRQMR